MAPKSPQPTAIISAMLYSLNDDFLRTCSVPSSYQVREKHLFYGSRYALGIGVASFASFFGGTGTGVENENGIWERGCEQRYSGKPDGAAGTPKTMYN